MTDIESATPSPNTIEAVDGDVVEVPLEAGPRDVRNISNAEQPMDVSSPTGDSSLALAEPSGLDNPFHPREGRDLVWKDVHMKVVQSSNRRKDNNETEKKILDNVWGEVPKRQVTAIMGPSGSGKTSLLNILAGRLTTKGQLHVTADVRLNNYAVDPTNLEVRKKIAFVAQDDSLQVTSTPRESIRFSAKLRSPRSITEEELDRLTDRMINELGLQDCADTYVGGALLKGISGGERKRTSVGVELVTRPALVFLDEPTSGLDSFNAVQLCQLLKKVANAGSSVLFTIHQPSSDIFASFDRLILLNKGRVMYQGSVQDVPEYFGERGHPVPPNFNPADWVMNVSLAHTIKELDDAGYFPADQRGLGEAFTSDGREGKDILGITNHDTDDEEAKQVTIGTQVSMLFSREATHMIRNTHALKARAAMTIMMSLVIGCIFYNVAETDFSDFVNIQSTFGALLMALLANVFSTAMPSLLSFPEERPVFLREYSTNHYSVISYFVARLFTELLVTAFQVTLSITITYLLIGFSGDYFYFWCGVYLMACASTAMGVYVGCTVENTSTAVEFLPAIFMPQILFSGFFLPPGLIPDWLAWIRHIFPLTYGVKILVAAEFGHGRCDDVTIPDGEMNPCARIMKNTGVDVDEVWWYYLVLLCLFVVVRTFALKNLKFKASKFY